MGYLDGLFITENALLESAIGKIIHFGEVLGKHSSISGRLAIDDIEVVSEDQNYISKTLDIFDSDLAKNTESKRKYFTLCGYNPLDCLTDVEDE